MNFFDCQSVITHMTTKIRRLIHILENDTFGSITTTNEKKPNCLTGKLISLYICIFHLSLKYFVFCFEKNAFFLA